MNINQLNGGMNLWPVEHFFPLFLTVVGGSNLCGLNIDKIIFNT